MATMTEAARASLEAKPAGSVIWARLIDLLRPTYEYLFLIVDPETHEDRWTTSEGEHVPTEAIEKYRTKFTPGVRTEI